jgi:hypothetical protein
MNEERKLPMLLGHESRLSAWVIRNWLWILIAAVLLIVAPLLTPGAIYFWSYGGFRSLLHDDLGVGANWAAVLALVCAFFYAIAVPYALRWLLIGRRRIQSLAAILVVFGSAPLLHAVLDSNFNQTSGEAQKWYVVRPGGDIVLSDSGGFDPATGVERHVLTPQIALIIERQKRGIRPQRVLGDPRKLTFFEPTTGRPLIWYSKAADGSVLLFEAEGFDPQTGTLLLPVTSEVVAAVRQNADAEDTRAQTAAAERTARAEKEAKERARQELAALFGADGYAPGVTIVGAKPVRLNDQVSAQAARALVADAMANLHSKGLSAAALSSAVYATSHYDTLMQGDGAILTEAGLSAKLREAVFALVEATCREAGSIGGVISCTVTANVRVLPGAGTVPSSGEWTEIGAATSQGEAVNRAAQLLIDRHPQILGAE